MTAHRAKEFANDGSLPHVLRDAKMTGANVRSIRASVNLSETTIASGDTLFIGTRPRGSRYLGHRITCGVSLGTTTVALGTAGATGKYRAAAAHTAVNTPTDVAIAAELAADPSTADEDMIATFGTASAPTSDHELVIETFYATDNA